jgi:hypothetical protein
VLLDPSKYAVEVIVAFLIKKPLTRVLLDPSKYAVEVIVAFLKNPLTMIRGSKHV